MNGHLVSMLTPLDFEDRLTWRPLRLYTFFRLLLVALLLTFHLALPGALRAPGGPYPLLAILVGWLILALIAGFTARLRRPGYALQVFVTALVDILAIVLLMHLGGGLESGLGVLLPLVIFAQGLLIPGRLALLLAALATFGIFGIFFEDLLAGRHPPGSIARAGLLGLATFFAAVTGSVLARRIRQSEALAHRQGVDLANLSRLNAHIVQRLQSGVLVVDGNGHVRLMNDRLWEMLELPDRLRADHIEAVSSRLAALWREWLAEPEAHRFERLDEAGRLGVRFLPLGNRPEAGTLILVESMEQIDEQTQQLRLAALGRLSASIAHEIRNPLSAIGHALQLLGESARLDGEDRHLIEIAEKHVRRVNRIIGNVLQLSRRQRPQPRTLLLADWLNEYVEEGIEAGQLDPDQVEVDVEPVDLRVTADPVHLRQILDNLVRNALEHADTSEPVRIRLQARPRREGGVELDVIDNGAPIDPDTARHMFEPFYTSHPAGTGLGLYLARELASSNGMRLRYHEAGGGRFRLFIPNAREDAIDS